MNTEALLDIPTLTDILEPGDPDMHRHFDTQHFLATDPHPATHENTQADTHPDIQQHISAAITELLPEFEKQVMQRVLEKMNSENTNLL